MQTSTAVRKSLHWYAPITKRDDSKRMVFGYATTPARDYEGDIITLDAVRGALPGYMQFANIREMHSLSAVGVTKEAEIDDHGLYIGAKVVDEQAWKKVVEGVYKGFSIGGSATRRDPHDAHTITGLELVEISLVDRPANPECRIEVWKAATPKENGMSNDAARARLIAAVNSLGDADLAKAVAALDKQTGGTAAQESSPVTAAAAVVVPPLPDAAAVRKTRATAIARRALADTAYAQSVAKALAMTDEQFAGSMKLGEDGIANWLANNASFIDNIEKAVPVIDANTITVAHIKTETIPISAISISTISDETVNKGVPSGKPNEIEVPADASADVGTALARLGKADAKASLRKGLNAVNTAVYLLGDLHRLQQRLEQEAAIEDDQSGMPSRMRAVVDMLAELVKALADEEIAELLAGKDYDALYGGPCQPCGTSVCYADNAIDMVKTIGRGHEIADFIGKAITKSTDAPGFAHVQAFVARLEKAADGWEPRSAGPAGQYEWINRAQSIHDASCDMGAKCHGTEMSKAAAADPEKDKQTPPSDDTKQPPPKGEKEEPMDEKDGKTAPPADGGQVHTDPPAQGAAAPAADAAAAGDGKEPVGKAVTTAPVGTVTLTAAELADVVTKAVTAAITANKDDITKVAGGRDPALPAPVAAPLRTVDKGQDFQPSDPSALAKAAALGKNAAGEDIQDAKEVLKTIRSQPQYLPR